MASIAASFAAFGEPKSGSPMLNERTGLPSAFIFLAAAEMLTVAEGAMFRIFFENFTFISSLS